MDKEELSVDEDGNVAASFEGILSMVGSDSVSAVTSVFVFGVDLRRSFTSRTDRFSHHVANTRS